MLKIKMMSEGEEGNAWIFPRQFIDSIQKDKKTKLSRSKTIWFIQDAGRALRCKFFSSPCLSILLESCLMSNILLTRFYDCYVCSLDHVVKSTAAVFFHRFYLFHGFEQHDRFVSGLF